MSDNDYYAPTAYDSTKPRELPSRLQGKDIPWGHGWVRGRPRLAWGIYFGDFRNINSKGRIEELKEKDETVPLAKTSPEILQFPTIHNPKAAWTMVQGVAGLFFLITAVVNLLGYLVKGGVAYFINEPHAIWVSAIPLAVFILGTLAISVVQNKNNIVFNRRTGRVWLPKQFGHPAIELPFDELDAYLTYEVNPKGGFTFWNLTLAHRAGPRTFDVFERMGKPAYIYQQWELLQQFMDTAGPLPDIAVLEPVRHLDPATADYDKKTGRPSHYWRDRDPDEVGREADEVDAVVQTFFWESLPGGNDPYIQEASVLAWRSYYPEQAAVADGLKTKGWWPGKEREAQAIPLSQA